MNAPDKTQAQTRRAVQILLTLAGHEVRGLRTSEVSKSINVIASTTTRDLQVLMDEGVVERVPGQPDGWRLGPKLVQIGLAHINGMARIEHQIGEVKQRFSREP